MNRIKVRGITSSGSLNVQLSFEEREQVLRYAQRFASTLHFVELPGGDNIVASLIPERPVQSVEGIRLTVGGKSYDLPILVANNAGYPRSNQIEIAADDDIRFGFTVTLSFSLKDALEATSE